MKWLKRLSIKHSTQIQETVWATDPVEAQPATEQEPQLMVCDIRLQIKWFHKHRLVPSANGISSLRLVLWSAPPIVMKSAINSRCWVSRADPINVWMKPEFKINMKNCSLPHKDSEKVLSRERREHIRGPFVLCTAQIVHVVSAHSIMSCSQAGPLLRKC